jgi:hypothetical protein
VQGALIADVDAVVFVVLILMLATSGALRKLAVMVIGALNVALLIRLVM